MNQTVFPLPLPRFPCRGFYFLQVPELSTIVNAQVAYDLLKKTGETLMKKLIVITAFVMLGTLANSAMAAKPLQEVMLTAGPIDEFRSCNIANHTGQDMDVFLNICFALKDNSLPAKCFDISPGTVFADAPVLGTIKPGHYEYAAEFKPEPLDSVTCELTYLGDPGDMTGVMCGVTATDTPCLPLQPH